MNIWIVEQSSGSWDDFITWPVCAFQSKEDAEAWIIENNDLLPSKLEKDKEDASEYDARYEEIAEKYDMADWNEEHPNFIKWRAEFDQLNTQWVEDEKALEYVNLHPYSIGNEIKLKLKS